MTWDQDPVGREARKMVDQAVWSMALSGKPVAADQIEGLVEETVAELSAPNRNNSRKGNQ